MIIRFSWDPFENAVLDSLRNGRSSESDGEAKGEANTFILLHGGGEPCSQGG